MFLKFSIVIQLFFIISCTFLEGQELISTDLPTSDNEGLTCPQILSKINTDVANSYGVTVECSNGILKAYGEDLNASVTTSCMDITDFSISASKIDLSINFKNVTFDSAKEELSGKANFSYAGEINSFSGALPNINEIYCDIRMDKDLSSNNISPLDFEGIHCDYLYGEELRTIEYQDVISIGNFINAEPDCADTESSLGDISDEAELNLAAGSLVEMLNQLVDL